MRIIKKRLLQIRGEFFRKKILGRICGGFLGGFSLPVCSLGKKKGKIHPKINSKIQIRIGSFAAKFHSAYFWTDFASPRSLGKQGLRPCPPHRSSLVSVFGPFAGRSRWEICLKTFEKLSEHLSWSNLKLRQKYTFVELSLKCLLLMQAMPFEKKFYKGEFYGCAFPPEHMPQQLRTRKSTQTEMFVAKDGPFRKPLSAHITPKTIHVGHPFACFPQEMQLHINFFLEVQMGA